MKKKHYDIERQGQMDFFDNYRIDYQDDNSILVDNTDGVYHGNIMEFKLNISNTGKVLFQAIKYLSKMRIKGESVPARILLIDLNDTKVYVYNSKDYIDDIQKVYVGAASVGNDAFSGNVTPAAVYDYMDMVDSAEVQKLLINKVDKETDWYIPIDIDETCIVGWAERYYREIPNATKGDFLGDDTGKVKIVGEIREPRHFTGLINPYKGKTNEKFVYLMDCLNSRLAKKDLGAFYTPMPYAKKAAELVQKAVERVPDGNDYIILDRCVDSETEFFNGTKWKKMADYVDGEGVLTWYTDGHASVEIPKRYINKPADEPFYHYISNTLDMCLSGSHNIVYEVSYSVKGSPLRKKPCYKVFEKWNKDSNGFRGRIPLTFMLPEKNDINESMLRVAVMINADGSYREKLITIDGSCKKPNNPAGLKHDIFEVRVYKQRKIERARMLLNNAGIKFKEKTIPVREKKQTGVSFLFRFPFNAKHFPTNWIYLPIKEKKAFLEELMYWDGSIGTNTNLLDDGRVMHSYRYCSSKKDDIDIVQLIAHSCGYSTRIRIDSRSKKINYTLNIRSNKFSKMTKEDKRPNVMKTGTFVKEFKDRKYCFETNSGYLVLRRNNKIFITGNCAGTGNLESALIGFKDKHGDDLISHCIVSTYEYYEYKVLLERIGDKVRNVIPPTEANVVFENGNVSNADAMSKEYIENPLIKRYVDDEHCTIILFENPPYRDTTSNSTGVGAGKRDYVVSEMSKAISGATLNELTNRFVWSGFHYYLRQCNDSYVLFSPVKYFKTCGLANKDFIQGYLFNREHFHATPSAISCILWGNTDKQYESIILKAYDIANGNTVDCGNVCIKKSYQSFSKSLYDKRIFATDQENGICCNLDGTERTNNKTIRVKKLFNTNIIGYIRASSFNFDALSRQLLRCGEYDANGFFLRKDTYLFKIPLWVSKNVPLDNWYEKDVYATTADGGDAYTHDQEFLKECLIYTCLSNQNKCLSFTGSDGRYYRNELTFDTTNGDTCASTDLEKFKHNPKTALDADEKKLLELWNNVLAEAKKITTVPATPSDAVRKDDLSKAVYNSALTYGVYQITKELNTSYTVGSGSRKDTVYDHPNLNSYLTTLRDKLKAYYKSHITEKMFKYELLK